MGAAAGASWRRWALGAAGLLLAVALPLLAVAARENPPTQDEPASRRGSAELLRAIELPRAAQDARAAGLTEPTLRETLELLQQHDVAAADAGAVFVAWVRLGSAAAATPLSTIVRERLDAGVRGPALAESLRSSARDPGTVVQTPPRPIQQVPRDSAGERRPLRDTARLLPPRDTTRLLPPPDAS